MALFAPGAFAKTIYVNLNATGANTGASWTDAFVLLESARAVAVPGDQIAVTGTTSSSADAKVFVVWQDKIRVFAAVPSEWRDTSFRDLRAEGAFLVSAARRQGETRWVRIRSEKGFPCSLVNPFPRQAVVLEDTASRKRRRLRGELLKFPTRAGHSYLLYCSVPAKRDLQMSPARAPHLTGNPFGVKAPDSTL